MKSAFIAGATGYTGRALVEHLCGEGLRVVAHVRPDSPRLNEWTEHFESVGAVVESCAWDVDSVEDAFEAHAPDLVYCLIGTTRKRAKKDRAKGQDSSYEAIDVGLTKILVRAAQGPCPSARFVYLSSLGVRQDTRNAYLKARWSAEQAVQGSGLDFTIVRPSFITGNGRDDARPMERVGGVVFQALLAVTGGLGARRLHQKYRPRDNKNLAERLAIAGTLEQFRNEVVTLDQIIDAEVDI